jgi:hypothetical protein
LYSTSPDALDISEHPFLEADLHDYNYISAEIHFIAAFG